MFRHQADVPVAAGRELRPPDQMSVGSLIPLSAIALVAFATGDDVHEWLVTWAVPVQALALGVFLLAMLPFAPFTGRYARQITPRAACCPYPVSGGHFSVGSGSVEAA